MITMNKTAAFGATLAAALALSACQSAPSSPVIQRTNATYETTGIADTKVKITAATLAKQIGKQKQSNTG